MSESLANPTPGPQNAVAPIYSRSGPPARLTPIERVIAVLTALACLSVLIIATRTEPSVTGIGTHRQLGLQPCGMLERTGIPCFACGMTTSFSWFVRGNLLASFYVQPAGMVLALGAAMIFWGATYVAISGRPAHRLLLMIDPRYYLLPLLLFGVAAWGWKIYIHLHGIDGWNR